MDGLKEKLIDVGISVGIALGTVYASFSKKLSDHDTRIAVLETQQKTDSDTIKKIDEKLDKLIDKLL